MDTKKAIGIVKELYWAADGEKMKIKLEDRDNIVDLLKRGERDGLIVKGVRKAGILIDTPKQKYFPKKK